MRTFTRSFIVFSCVLLPSFTTQVAAARTERVFIVRGVVQAPHQDGMITIQHEEIPGYMPAMTMPFYADAAEASALSPGDRVEFKFLVGDGSRATAFKKIGKGEIRQSGLENTERVAMRKRLREGDAVPSFTLIDHDNRPLTDAILRDRHTLITFIFTRCPVPEFCPLIARKFQTLQARLKAITATDVQLLSITIDPEFDRPEILRRYGQSLEADFNRWRFATGDADEVEKLTKLFAVRTERNGGALDHTLATALVGPDGNIIAIWRGNGWRIDEVIGKLSTRSG